MNNEFVTHSNIETRKLANDFASQFKGGEIICLSGDLGAGKTTFTQGLLKGFGIKGPYTSPTFAILKQYKVSSRMYNASKTNQNSRIIHNSKYIIQSIYHIDAYRISSKDLIELGFEDFADKENSITIIEWPEKVKRIIPTSAIWIDFEWLSDKERKITFSKK